VLRARAASQTRDDVDRRDDAHVAHNYAPFPVRLVRAEGAWAEDDAGRRYLDLFAGYSALNFGHRHPRWWPPPTTSSTG
jgi:ornithine--oxo-acid transaminase